MIDTEEIKQATDLLALAGTYTKLKRIARNEWAGPCPHCGGTDRFHVNTDLDLWMCRTCTGEARGDWGDVIDLVRFVDGCTFLEAAEKLSGARPPAARTGAAPPIPPVGATWTDDTWQKKAWEAVESACAALATAAGAAGQQYLQQRGIDVSTQRAWLLGYVPTSPKGGPSITIPYLRHDAESIMAIRYRRIDPHDPRYINKAGSEPIFCGLHLVDLSAPLLVIVEGELNAISIGQAARGLGITVVSTGSQTVSTKQRKAISWLSARFRNMLVWCDTPEKAEALQAEGRAERSLSFQSPEVAGMKLDANALLQHGRLRGVLELIVQQDGWTMLPKEGAVGTVAAELPERPVVAENNGPPGPAVPAAVAPPVQQTERRLQFDPEQVARYLAEGNVLAARVHCALYGQDFSEIAPTTPDDELETRYAARGEGAVEP